MKFRPLHGGRLGAAAQRWNIPLADWLDLSTGINPVGWPVPELPPELWRRLPEDEDDLQALLREWAGAPPAAGCVPVAGSQAAIQMLPRLRAPCRVGVPDPGYQEHSFCWANAGHQVLTFQSDSLESIVDRIDVLVWVQPNNPTGERLEVGRLLKLHTRLAAKGGWLIVDEAFCGGAVSGELSIAGHTTLPGLVVLRSVGKFFGLAGARAGAVFAEPALCSKLDSALGPWALSGPTRYVLACALQDHEWQAQTFLRLKDDSLRLAVLLRSSGLTPDGGTELFQYVRTTAAAKIAAVLARQGILVRLFDEPAALRFGLPGSELQWQRLTRSLATLSRNNN